jgi:hypothetical protein
MVMGINIDKLDARLVYCLFGHTFWALLWPLLWTFLWPLLWTFLWQKPYGRG